MPQTKTPPKDAPKDAPGTDDTPGADAPITGDSVVDRLFDRAHELADEKKNVLDAIRKNREALRTLADAGAITPEGVEELDKLYPPRESKDKNESGESPKGESGESASKS